MTLNGANGKRLASFLVGDYHLMYHFHKPESLIDYYVYSKTNYLSTKDIVKVWVKEPNFFYRKPTHIYKTKSLRRAYQLLIFLCCRIYDQQSTETFPEGWAFLLDQVVKEGKPFNWSDLLAQQLWIHVSNPLSSPKGIHAKFYMFSYLLYAIYAQNAILGMN